MAELAVTTINRDGVDLEFVTADSEGDVFANTGKEFVLLKNEEGTGTGSNEVTVKTTATVDGEAVADKSYTLELDDEILIGPFPTRWYNNEDGQVELSYDDVDGLRVAVLSLTQVT